MKRKRERRNPSRIKDPTPDEISLQELNRDINDTTTVLLILYKIKSVDSKRLLLRKQLILTHTHHVATK